MRSSIGRLENKISVLTPKMKGFDNKYCILEDLPVVADSTFRIDRNSQEEGRLTRSCKPIDRLEVLEGKKVYLEVKKGNRREFEVCRVIEVFWQVRSCTYLLL